MPSTATKERGRISAPGMGGFLNPPTHPEHDLHVETDLRKKPENRGGLSLSSAVESEWLDDATRDQARDKLESWTRPALDDERIIDWIAQVLGYFRNCYRGTDEGRGEWAAEALRINASLDPLENAEDHAGVRYIRKFYPEYQPTADDFERACWGSK